MECLMNERLPNDNRALSPTNKWLNHFYSSAAFGSASKRTPLLRSSPKPTENPLLLTVLSLCFNTAKRNPIRLSSTQLVQLQSEECQWEKFMPSHWPIILFRGEIYAAKQHLYLIEVYTAFYQSFSSSISCIWKQIKITARNWFSVLIDISPCLNYEHISDDLTLKFIED